jgi:methionine--tRNA ligase beta chain
MITIDEFKKGEISIGEIKAVELIEGSDKLLKLTVDFAEEKPRTIVSGIRKYFGEPQDLVGTKCAFATNLEPRPLMGIPSEAMILAASTEDGKFSVLKVSDDIPAGTKIK